MPHNPTLASAPPANSTLPTGEYQMLDRAWLVMKNGDPKMKGWFLGYPAQRLICDTLIRKRLLETQYRPMQGTNPAGSYYRITKAGCQALTRVYIDHDAFGSPASAPVSAAPAAAPAPAPAASPLYGDQVVSVKVPFPVGSKVLHLQNRHVGVVTSSWVASRRLDEGGSVEIEYLKVQLFGKRVGDGISWQVDDVRLATDAEVDAYRATGSPLPVTVSNQDDDDETDETTDAQEPQTPARGGAHGAAAETLAAPALGDATAPLLESWQEQAVADLESVLKLLHRLAPTTHAGRLRTQELLTMNRTDLDLLIEKSGRTSYWKGYLTDAEATITQLVGEQILAPLHEYVQHLRAVGAEIAATQE
jgi:hypothetical protein